MGDEDYAEQIGNYNGLCSAANGTNHGSLYTSFRFGLVI